MAIFPEGEGARSPGVVSIGFLGRCRVLCGLVAMNTDWWLDFRAIRPHYTQVVVDPAQDWLIDDFGVGERVRGASQMGLEEMRDGVMSQKDDLPVDKDIDRRDIGVRVCKGHRADDWRGVSQCFHKGNG